MRGESLVKRDRDGIWYCRPYLGVNRITGRPIRPYRRFPQARTKAEAERLAEEWVASHAEAAKLGVSSRLSELVASYIDTLEAAHAPVNTVKTYRSTLRCYIAPNVGRTRVDEFTTATATALYNVVLMQESRRGGKISPNTVLKMHWLLAGAFKHFARSGLCAHNPMLAVTHPDPVVKEARAYDEHEFARIASYLQGALRSSDASPEAVFARSVAFATYLSLWHGTRAGETLALSIEDAQLWRSNLHVHCTMVDDAGVVTRQEKTKGRRSRNVSIYDEVVPEIEEHLAWADAAVPRRRDVPRMVVTMPDGSYVRPSDLSRAFGCQVRDRLGLPSDTHFHTLRHTHATWMILQGADIVSVAERLGHAKESMTLELYGHLMPGRDAAAVEAFAEFARWAERQGQDQRRDWQ